MSSCCNASRSPLCAYAAVAELIPVHEDLLRLRRAPGPENWDWNGKDVHEALTDTPASRAEVPGRTTTRSDPIWRPPV
jgi:hypothetical protein